MLDQRLMVLGLAVSAVCLAGCEQRGTLTGSEAGGWPMPSAAVKPGPSRAVCPLGAGFWCQNQDGRNPNLTAEEFKEFAEAAATLLSDVEALDTAEKIAAAVCNIGDQLLRQLAALALNLAAETLARETALVNEPGFANVGAPFDAAVEVANDPSATRDERNEIKDVLDRINNGQNIEGCDSEPDDGEDGGRD